MLKIPGIKKIPKKLSRSKLRIKKLKMPNKFDFSLLDKKKK